MTGYIKVLEKWGNEVKNQLRENKDGRKWFNSIQFSICEEVEQEQRKAKRLENIPHWQRKGTVKLDEN